MPSTVLYGRFTGALFSTDDEAMGFIRRGETAGVFQMESAVCREMCQAVRPDSFKDIVAILAMDRPGALAQQTHEK